MRYPLLAQRLFNTPLMIHPGKLAAILAAMRPRFEAEYEIDLSAGPLETSQRERTALRVASGVAVIDVHGTLVQRSGFMDAESGLVSYERIRSEFDEALDRDDVEAILLRVDSPGGEVAGSFELSDHIHDARGIKPIVALADEMAASAAYLIASAADEVYATQSALTGSIGVIMAHRDISGAEAEAGMKVTEITSGARKADMSPHKPLADDARAALQGHVDSLAALFFQHVARNRGIPADAVEALQAAVYVGADASALGLINDVRAPGALMASLIETAGVRPLGGVPMDKPEDSQESPEPGDFLAANPEVAERLRAEGASAERERILALENKARGRFPELVAKAKAEGWPLERFAVAALDAPAEVADKAPAILRAIREDGDIDLPAQGKAVEVVTSEVAPEALKNLPAEARIKAEWDANPSVRAEWTWGDGDDAAFERFRLARLDEMKGEVA